MTSFDHESLRLPPDHPDLNPIEKAVGSKVSVKNLIASHNTTFKLREVKELEKRQLF